MNKNKKNNLEKTKQKVAVTAETKNTSHVPVPLCDDEAKQAVGGAVGEHYWDSLNRLSTSTSTPKSEHPFSPKKPHAALR